MPPVADDVTICQYGGFKGPEPEVVELPRLKKLAHDDPHTSKPTGLAAEQKRLLAKAVRDPGNVPPYATIDVGGHVRHFPDQGAFDAWVTGASHAIHRDLMLGLVPGEGVVDAKPDRSTKGWMDDTVKFVRYVLMQRGVADGARLLVEADLDVRAREAIIVARFPYP